MGSSILTVSYRKSIAIRSYSGEGKDPLLPMLGKFTATLTRGEKEIVEPVYVVKGQGDTALLSRGAAERMGLVQKQRRISLPAQRQGWGNGHHRRCQRWANRMVQQCCSYPKERRRKHQGKAGHDRCQQVRGLSNAVDQIPVVSPFPRSENRKCRCAEAY